MTGGHYIHVRYSASDFHVSEVLSKYNIEDYPEWLLSASFVLN